MVRSFLTMYLFNKHFSREGEMVLVNDKPKQGRLAGMVNVCELLQTPSTAISEMSLLRLNQKVCGRLFLLHLGIR